MNTQHRRDDIVRMIESGGKVRVSELSRLYGITEVSVRKDLEALEKEGFLRRVHGGAVAVSRSYLNMDIKERCLTNAALKEELAAKAARLICDNDTIMMNSGTTLLYVLRALRGRRNVSIVTNYVRGAEEAAEIPSVNVVLLGGQLDTKYLFTYGKDAVAQLAGYHANKLILSLDGVSASDGLSLYYPNEIDVILAMAAASDTVVVAADSSKIGRSAFSRVAPASAADLLVTDSAADPAALAALRGIGVALV